MFELLIVLGLVVCLVAATLVAWTSLLAAGTLVTGAGLLFGLPAALGYHIVLARGLGAVNALEPRWWLRPASLHARLDEAGRRRVLPWFYIGGAGFVVTVIGLSVVSLGIVVGYFRG
ncbi:MAG TPA: hypothetical protein VFR64_03630 [Methylomirabilota bacterium]|nr:hypothetical protein [Methylomirabilota bacterium]